MNRQSPLAEALLDVVGKVLHDPDYVALLKQHYRLAKKAVSSRDPAVRQAVAQVLAEQKALMSGGETAAAPQGTTKRKQKTDGGSAEPKATMDEMAKSVPRTMRPAYEAVVAITDAFCGEHLNDEYSQLSRKLAAALARKRPSPLATGKPRVWACGIVYALGSVNFLWDKTQTPHMSAGELCERFGVGKSTCSSKARSIMEMFRMVQDDPRWCLPSKMDDNPLVWMLSVDGFIMDVRDAPREIQEEALRKGLIPYMPKPREDKA